MEFTINVDDTMFDELFNRRLIEDYLIICADIENLERVKSETGKLERFQQEDYVDANALKHHFERLMEYYMGTGWDTKVNAQREENKTDLEEMFT